MTKKNQTLLQLIREYNGHLNAQEIYDMSKEKDLDISVASIYRILDSFEKKGYIKKIDVGKQSFVYDCNTYQHAHLVCDKCGKIVDVKLDIEEAINSALGKKIDSYELCMHFICDECREEK